MSLYTGVVMERETENMNTTSQEVDSPDAGPSSADPGGLEAETSIESLQQILEATRAEKEEQLRAWQRTQADFVNYRRRTEQERADLIKTAEADLIRDLLPIVDDMQRALTSLPPELRGLTWVEGILLIERKLSGVLEIHGLRAIEAVGKEFNPHEHEAILTDGEPGDAPVVTAELQRGYRLNDWVLRPTLVKVGPPPETSTG